MAKEKFRYYNPDVAGVYDRREATRKAIDAGVMAPPFISLARAFKKSEQKEQGIEMVHREFSLMKDSILEKLTKRKMSAGVVEAILRKIKEAENNLISVVSKS